MASDWKWFKVYGYDFPANPAYDGLQSTDGFLVAAPGQELNTSITLLPPVPLAPCKMVRGFKGLYNQSGAYGSADGVQKHWTILNGSGFAFTPFDAPAYPQGQRIDFLLHVLPDGGTAPLYCGLDWHPQSGYNTTDRRDLTPHRYALMMGKFVPVVQSGVQKYKFEEIRTNNMGGADGVGGAYPPSGNTPFPENHVLLSLFITKNGGVFEGRAKAFRIGDISSEAALESQITSGNMVGSAVFPLANVQAAWPVRPRLVMRRNEAHALAAIRHWDVPKNEA